MKKNYYRCRLVIWIPALLVILFNNIESFGQTGPAGVGNANGTAGEPQNTMWLDASDLSSFSNGDTWFDKSGNSNSLGASGAAGSTYPSLQTGSFNYLNFTGTNRLVRNPFTGFPGTQISTFIVYRTSDASEGILSYDLAGQGNEYLILNSNNITIYVNGNGKSTGRNFNGNNWSILTNQWKSDDGRLLLLKNGGIEQHSSIHRQGDVISNGGSLAIGSEQDGVDSGYDTNQEFEGDMAEVILYNSFLTSVQRTIVENYLSQKYSITIAKDYFGNSPDYTATYNRDMRGIGSDGTNKRTDAQSSGALRVRENANSLDANEYVMLAHNNTAHAVTTANRADLTNITDRWARDWYVERNTGGGVAGVDGGDISTQMVFDFATAGLPYSGNLSSYVLLYRSTSSGNFDRVYADSYTVEGTDKVVVSVPASRLKTGYYTLGTGTPLLARTWYVFQDGNWTDANTWTTDASTAPLYKNPGGNIPGAADEVIIRSGRTVTIQPATVSQQVNSIKVDGNLYLTNSTGHNFNVINGSGIIRLAGHNLGGGLLENFPQGNTMGNLGFADADNGGTVVVHAAADITLNTAHIFRHMRIELTNNASKAILGADISLNGDLEVRNGKFQFGDGTAMGRTLSINGHVLVTNNGSTRIGSISTATVSTTTPHKFVLKGDFTNNGTARFTNRTDFTSVVERRNPANTYYTTAAANGIVEVSFTNDNAHQKVHCNNTTYFYRVIIDKGVDDTYKLSFQSNNIDYFRLLGPANTNVDNDLQSATQNTNAFALINGTAEIGSNVEIPVLNTSGNYAISSTTRLWVNGGDVRKTGGTAIVPYGKVQVSAGYLGASVNSGLTVRQNGLIIVEGGSVFANQIRTSIQGANSLGGYQQSGGSVVVDGSAGTSNDYYVFSLTYTGNVFLMSGGTLTVRGINSKGAIFINSDPSNINVTGGAVIVESSNVNVAKITSRAPFYNTYMRAGGNTVGNIILDGGTSGLGAESAMLAAQPLVVKNDLIVQGYGDSYYNNPLGNFPVTFSAVTSATNVNDVYVGGSFYVGRNSTYQAVFGGNAPYDGLSDLPTNYNTTYFNQTTATSAIDTVYWGVTSGQMEMGNFVLNRNSDNELRTIARSGNNGTIRFDVNGSASVLLGTLDQNAYTFRIWGSITNKDRLGTYYSSGTYPVTGGTPSLAQIRFREDAAVTISTIDNAIFGNLRFNVGAGTTVELNSDIYIERMEYLNGRIYVKNHTLTVDKLWNINNGGGAYFNNDEANSSIIRVNNEGITANILVFTDGKASDGGLRLRVTDNTVAETTTSRVNNDGPITFPVGFTPDGGSTFISRPAQMKVKNFADSGYVKINVVSGELQTTDLAGGEILQHYWTVRHADFATLPTVAFRFYYRGSNTVEVGRDRPTLYAAGNEDNYVPGYVLDGGIYSRRFESDPTQDQTDIFTSSYQNSGVNNRTRIITFNGTNSGGEFTQAGFAGFGLSNANYTAGVAARFIGSPEVYYSSTTNVGNNTETNNSDKWNQSNRWSTVGHYSGVNTGTYPQAGDIAILGFGLQTATSTADNTQRAHWYFVDQDVDVASLVYASSVKNQNGIVVPRNNSYTPQLVINDDAALDVKIGTVEGVGTFNVEVGCSPCNASPASSTAVTANILADFGLFASEESSRFDYDLLYSSNNVAVYLPTFFPEVYPNVNVKGQDNNRTLIFQEDITINRNLVVRQQATVRLSDLAKGDITVHGNLDFTTNNRNDRVEFPSAGPGRTLRVEGDIVMQEDDRIEVLDNNNAADVVLHRLQVGGNITKADGRIILYNGPEANRDHAILELIGTSNGEYTSTNNNNDRIIRMYHLKMNKGTTKDATFTFQDNFRIVDANSSFQPIEILNGTLIINAPTINPQNAASDQRLLLANGSNFYLPNTTNTLSSSGSGGLEIRQGMLQVTGANTGLVLDGLLRISGGTLDMDGGANVNNFIEYSSSGQARLEVSSGTLTVGSQIRRGLNSSTGVLQYIQSGGTVVVGKNAAPEANRGVFEVANGGSHFEHTGGSLTLIRHNNSLTVPSLLLEPETDNVANGTVITIGDGSTPTNQNRFGIQSSIKLAEVAIASPNATAKLYSLPLAANILNIGTNANFNANGFDLTIHENLNNNGTFITSGNTINGQTTFFPITTTASITGIGTTNFWNFEKSGMGTLALAKNVTVNNNAFMYEGTFNTQSSAFNIKKDLVHDALHISALAGPGIVFNGTQQQILDRSSAGTSEFGVVNVNNTSGLLIRDTDENFQINSKLTLTSGILDIGGNLLIFSADAFIENGSGGTSVGDFNASNMIQTNSAIRDFGIRKMFNTISSGNETFTYPLGLIAYTPVVVNINDISASSITIRPVKDVPPIAEDMENTLFCTDPNITDAGNVLQYYWIVKSSGVNNFNGNFTMYYDANDTKVTSPYTVANYGPARLYNLSEDWDKVFTTADFDETNRKIVYPFSGNTNATVAGIYTAGVTLKNDGVSLLCGAAIPDQVPQFFTNSSGGGNFFSILTYLGSISPILGETPDITVRSGDLLRLNLSNIRTRKITIEAGGTLVVQNGTNNHNLGFVTGEGTIRLESNGSSVVFPTGDYEEFFPDANCVGGGTLEYTGTGNYAVLSDLPNVRKIMLTGSGNRILPNNFALNICEDLEIRGSVNVIVPDGNNTMTIRGNLYKSDGSDFDNGAGNSRIVMAGTSAQAIRGAFTVGDELNDLQINNAAGVTIINAADAPRGIAANQDVTINNKLILTTGILTTNTDNTLTIGSAGSHTGGSATSYINGPLTKNNISASTTYQFPIGKNGRYSPAAVVSPTTGNQNWTAEYFTTNQRGRTAIDPASGLVDISDDMWRITSSGPNESSIRVHWNTASGVTNINDTRVVYWDNKNNPAYSNADNDGIDNRWESRGGTSFAGNTSGGSVTSANPIAFSTTDITFGTVNQPLPVKIINFAAITKGEIVELTWQTVTELNNDIFEIQHSTDGQQWSVIGTVEGQGNSNKLVSYQHHHSDPQVGTNFYRLKQVDYDGKYDYSQIVNVEVESNKFEDVPTLVVFPNPAKDNDIHVKVAELANSSGIATLKVTDLYGKTLLQKAVKVNKLADGLSLQGYMRPLPSGVYIVRVQYSATSLQTKLIIE